MTTKLRRARSVLATALVLVAGVILAMRTADAAARTTVVAYFDNSNGVFAGDDVLIRGVPVGKIVKIEPQPLRAKISFWFDRKYRVPADAAAAILSPQLVTGRAIQLTPPYAGGPTMADGTVIPQERTVVPVEWDDLRAQLQRLTALLQPTRPGGVSTLGALINTAADNLRGQGATIRDTIIKLSQAISALGDHSKDIFSTVTNLSTLVTALHDSADLLERLNHNLAAVTSLLADGPDKIGQAAEDLNAVVADVGSFAAEHREAIGTASDKLASITTALVDSLDDIKQTLHISPTVLQNFNNIFEPANGALTGALAGNNMANPIAFLCGAIQAASRLGGEQAAKLCVQYLAPIVKNRQYNYPPLGANLFVGAQARPNEVTYSEDWLRPDYVAPVADTPPDPAAAVTVDPATGLRGMMMPPGGGWLVRIGLTLVMIAAVVASCGWRGLNSLPLPGTQGNGPGSFAVQAQLPDVNNIQPNSRVRVADVTVGHVTKIERQGWHALVTMRLDGDVDLPANATAKIGTTSLLGSYHIELAPPKGEARQGKLRDGSLIALSHGSAYPSTEQTLAALSLVLNGGGLGQVQDITEALSTAFAGREHDLRGLIGQLDTFTAYLNNQSGDIIAATDSLNRLVGKFADQQPVFDRALATIPDALAVLADERDTLVEAAEQLSKFSALTVDSVNKTTANLVTELRQLGPVLESLANSGPALTRSLSLLATFPFPNETFQNFQRGEYANLTAIVDLTLSRIDQGLLTGTRWECHLTQLELQWGRTIGQFPSPCTAGYRGTPGNPLTIAYRWDQGP